MLRAFSLTAASLIAAACAPSSGKAEISTGARPFEITAVATFNEPWAMAFVPGTPYALITEKGMEEPLSLRSVAPVKFKPVMVTDVP